MSTVPSGNAPPQFRCDGTDSLVAAPTSGASGPATGAAISRRHRLRTLRRFAVGAFALICIIGVLQSRITASHAQTRTDAERLQAVAQASALLFSPPAGSGNTAPVLATPDDTRATGMLPVGSTGPDAHFTPPAGPNRSDASPSRQSAIGPPDGFARLAPLPGPSSPANAALSGAPDAAQLHEAVLHAAISRTPARYTRPFQHEIPGTIEGYPPRYTDGDALASLAITFSLRVFDSGNAPLRLVATRIDDGPPRAQLQGREATGPVHAAGGWLEAGDSPAPGWYVVAISRADVLLLSPLGNPVRLRLAPGPATAAVSSKAATHTPAGPRLADR